jgi:MFS family permease
MKNSRNISLYYLLTVFMNAWFITSNWVFFYSRYLSIPQIGFIDGISKLVSVFLEVPSGALADVIGKKATLILGNLFFGVSCAIISQATGFTWFLIGNMVMFVGFACISGAREALLYDSLVELKQENRYDEVLGKVNSIATAMTIFSIFMGGLLYRFNPAFPFIAWMVSSGCAVVVLLMMREPAVDTEQASYTLYFTRLKSGVSSVFSKSLVNFVLPVLFFSMLMKSYEGIVRQNTAAYFGFTGETFGYALAAILIPTVLISFNYGKVAAFLKDAVQYVFIAFYLVGFAIIYATQSMVAGLISLQLIYLAQELARPYLISLVNKNTDSKHRATALSTVSLFSEFPYMILVIFFGNLIAPDSIKFLYLGFVFVLVLYSLIRKAQDFLPKRTL